MTNVVIIFSLALSTAVLIPTTVIARGYLKRPNQVTSVDDWVTLLIPCAAPVVAMLLAYATWRNEKGILFGSLVGATAYLLIPAGQLCANFDLIAADGTAYWGLMYMPAVFLGVPLVAIGALVGRIFGGLAPNK